MVIFLEGKNDSAISSAYKSCVIFYTHCIKWRTQPQRQGSSWTESVINSARNVKNRISNTNVRNDISSRLREAFEEGVVCASKEMHENAHDPEFVFESFNSIDKITDIEYVRSWLIQFAEGDESIDVVNGKKFK